MPMEGLNARNGPKEGVRWNVRNGWKADALGHAAGGGSDYRPVAREISSTEVQTTQAATLPQTDQKIIGRFSRLTSN